MMIFATLSVFLSVHSSFLEKLQQRWHASFFDDEFPVTVVVASKGDEGSGCVGTFVQGSTGEKNGDLFPDEAENGLVGGDGREAQVLVVALVGGGTWDARRGRCCSWRPGGGGPPTSQFWISAPDIPVGNSGPLPQASKPGPPFVSGSPGSP
eukprot:XP_014622529.1 uncharacterized protein LOC106795999 [Glycine max]